MPLADSPAHHAPAYHARARARAHRLERKVVRRINRVRRHRGLVRLRPARRLVFVAKVHSADMARHRRVSHSSTNGTPFDARIRSVIDARAVGETIIAFRGRRSARGIVRAWMRSPAHRDQLLTGAYRRVGVGHATARGHRVVTADFATR